ncbi:ATP-binding protein [Flavobacterium chuncheonense]|uniref:histidine kinase n=1 Tax=Flavobacterium chuncheonense TaxID=2026653 RepID=A0ABW5YJH3_9FLAO
MNSIGLVVILLFYLVLLFFIAHWAEKKENLKWTNNAYVYAFSLAVYCTAWTYYGSIGVAAKSGLNYLPIYIGPVIIIPAWIIILRKIIRISKVNTISSIADFISLRYGNSRFLGALVTLVSLAAILPYIALQLKAISETFHVVTETKENSFVLFDTTTYVAVALALFSSYYGTRYVDASEKRKGIITAVALESLLKLIFFLVIGIYVTYFVFDGFEDIYQKASVLEGFHQKNSIGGLEQGMNWFFLCMVSLFAIFLLPRQFHVSIVENNREKHIKTAIWLFPLYLLLFNLFVFPIAWGGNVLFEDTETNADTYSLLIPQLFQNKTLTVLVFLGGFSAAISMIVVSSISLSTMLSNNILIPYTFLGRLKDEEQDVNNKKIVNIRKVGIFILIILSYFIYRFLALDYSLFSIGLVAFVIIAQLAPSFFGALFWKRGSRLGAIWGIIIGFLVCCYTLLIPYVTGISNTNNQFVTEGLFSIDILKPLALFGLDYLSPISHSFFWSMMFNVLTYFSVSLSFKGNYRERNYAEMYVDIDKYSTNHENAFVWKGTAYISDIEKVLVKFLGQERTQRALQLFSTKYNLDKKQELADARLIKFAENLLSGHIGTASSRILISSVVKEEKITLPEVLKILEESNQTIITNKKLIETSNALQKTTSELQLANKNLQLKDLQKDEFLDTVTHELRTPITAIRAASEILIEDEELPEDLKKQFLQNIISESDRLSRLIDKILDLEKFESGKQKLNIQEHDLVETIQKTIVPLQQLIKNKGIQLFFENNKTIKLRFDEDRMIQVVTNLISNAIKFCPDYNGLITIIILDKYNYYEIAVMDNGKGVNPNDFDNIFDKFYQSNNQNIKKPVGSGLGLAICKQIIELHKGKIWAQNNNGQGACFTFTLLKNDSL